ncbi:unnamed protein product [Adineta steineri]|uniref:Uncharacterized protein n=1 Tax=Adineta steineri TaxID=433720 RepID=A0A818UXS9_9BILA|nr:unnamed protein product [Adineta steineri]CAF3704311.1 unnamed protein product [Adineta steineri]
MVGIFMGSLFTWKYIEGEDNRKNYATTTCLVVNYTVYEYNCAGCNFPTCDTKCLGGQFVLKYSITGGTYRMNTFTKGDERYTDQKSPIGSNLACYYDPADVDSVILEFPDSKSELNYACAAFGISAVLGICILLIFIYKARMDRLKNTKQDKDHVELGELMNTSTN